MAGLVGDARINLAVQRHSKPWSSRKNTLEQMVKICQEREVGEGEGEGEGRGGVWRLKRANRAGAGKERRLIRVNA